MTDNSMRKVIRGVVVDHRLPTGKGSVLSRPILDKLKWAEFYALFKHRSVTHPYYTFPAFLGISLVATYALGMVYKSYVLGYSNRSLDFNKIQTRQCLWGLQVQFNENPYNLWNNSGNCWSTDPYCGLDEMPKRPWEVLKDPEKAFYKLKRDVNKHPKRD